MKYKLLLLTMTFCAGSFIARANTDPGAPTTISEGKTSLENKKTDIVGGVIHSDTRKPIGNVSVTAYSASRKEKVVLTDGTGNFSFSELKAGTYRLVFEKQGYKKVTREKVIVKPDEGCQINIEMDLEDQFQIMPSQLFSDFD